MRYAVYMKKMGYEITCDDHRGLSHGFSWLSIYLSNDSQLKVNNVLEVE